MTPLNTRRLVPIGLAVVLSMLALVPANAQSSVDTTCTIPLFGGSCEFQCVKDKSATGSVTGALASLSVSCPESGSATCNTAAGSCTASPNIKVKEFAVGVCKTSGAFVYRASCNGAA